MSNCKACGKCCKKHWLLKLTNKYEKELFQNSIVFGEYIWTDKCKFLKDFSKKSNSSRSVGWMNCD